ncbi:hypothetical protein FQN49_003827 [Arthroderma sp. PD_2]|nr:hypothetical protein FQN49_003827 [Arthroderma sp. PD_2]
MDHDHGHGDMDMGNQCSMNMLFTFSTKNLCIIFPQWRVTGLFTLLLSLMAVVALVAGYEALREFTRRYELSTLAQKDLPSGMYSSSSLALSPCLIPFSASYYVSSCMKNGRFDNSLSMNWQYETVVHEGSSLLFSARTARGTERQGKVVRAALYAAQVFYSFFIM